LPVYGTHPNPKIPQHIMPGILLSTNEAYRAKARARAGNMSDQISPEEWARRKREARISVIKIECARYEVLIKADQQAWPPSQSVVERIFDYQARVRSLNCEHYMLTGRGWDE
jgi:hypothetical protein